MTQTQTPPAEDPDPDRRPDLDSGPDPFQTQTIRTGNPDSDSDRASPSPNGPGPDETQTQTQTQTETPDPDQDSGPRKIAKHRAGPSPSPETAQTQTQTANVEKRATRAARWLGAGGYLTALTVVVGVVASLGQKEYAEKKARFVDQIKLFGFDLTPWFAPFVFDLFVAALLHGGLRAARDRNSPWPWWICGGMVAGLSTFTNFQHDGGMITGTASIGLFLAWGLYLLNEYKKIIRAREVDDSADEEFRSTDVLFTIDKPLAQRAWLIARTKPLAAALAYRHKLGETQLTKRDVAMIAARIYREVAADWLDILMLDPSAAAPAGTGKDGVKPAKRPGRVRWWQHRRRARAIRLATMTASDAVDRYLGLPVIDRAGVVVARVTYAVADSTPLLGAVTAVAPPPALPAGVAAHALPAAPTSSPPPLRPHRRVSAPVAAVAGAAAAASGEVIVGAVPEAPAGLAGKNWLPLDQLPELPTIDPGLLCECHPKDPAQYCGLTLAEHVQRRGQQIRQIIDARRRRNELWHSGPRVGKNEVHDTCDLGSSASNVIGWLFDQLRECYTAQQFQRDGAATEATVITAEQGLPDS